MTHQCLVCALEFNTCSSSRIKSEDNETPTNRFSDEEFWNVFSKLFQLDSSIISPNCSDSWELKFCSKCKSTGVKLFNLHHQLLCIERQLSQTIAHVSSTILQTENRRTERNFNDNRNDDIRRVIHQRFTPRIILQHCQGQPNKLFKRHSSQHENEGPNTLKVVKIESSPYSLREDEDNFNSADNLSHHGVEEDDCAYNSNNGDDEDHLVNNENENNSDFDAKEFNASKTINLEKPSKVKRVKKKSGKKTLKTQTRTPKEISQRKQRKARLAERRKLLEVGDLVTRQPEPEAEPEEESIELGINHSRVIEIGPGEYLYLEKYGYILEPDGYYKCQSCTTGRRKKQTDVHRHINNKHNKTRFTCDKCTGHWDTKNKMDKHVCRPKLYVRQPRIRKHDDDRFSYDNEYFFVKRNDLFQCETCNEAKKCLSSMTAHIVRRHAAPNRFVCEHCGASFGSKKNFQSHIVQHDNARPFLCDQCPAAFKTSGHLWCHQKSHNGPKYECNVCEKKFKYSHGLARHRLSAGHPVPPKPQSDSLFYCPKCNNSYLHQYTLDLHLKTCKGKKEFECNECDKKFPKLSVLRGHQYWRHKKPKQNTKQQQQPAPGATNSSIESQQSEILNVDLNENPNNKPLTHNTETGDENLQ